MTDPTSKCPVDHSSFGHGAPYSSEGAQAPTAPAGTQEVPFQSEQTKTPADADDRLPYPTEGDANRRWWPKKLDLKLLAYNPEVANPLDAGFDYRTAFLSLDLAEVKRDIEHVLTDSQPWWPADFGHYGPFIIRLAWHSAGTYRVFDGRGGGASGQQRFAPLNSWPDNVSLDKGRRLLWPVKKKYGQSLSWADLFILAGNVALESQGFPTIGFSGGREDVWEPENVYWGSETTWLGTDKRYGGTNNTTRELQKPLAAAHLGLIYVNPEGPEGVPDPLAAARDIRETFKRMGFDDEGTVALIAGGHTFGKTHGAASDGDHVGVDPEEAPLENQGLGWKSSYGTGKGADTITSGIEATWTYHPTRWDNEFFHILYGYEWEVVKGEGGHFHWRPKDGGGSGLVPEAHGEGKREPRFLTTDIALRVDPEYDRISRRFKDDHQALTRAFGEAWFKLTHRDFGPKSRYLGAEVPAEDFIWQDPLPERDHELVDAAGIAALEQRIAESGLSVAQLVTTAWASASTFRGGDKRGGANGARIRLEPQRSWEVNEPERLAAVLATLEEIQSAFNAESGEQQISLADLIVLAGNVGVQQAAAAAGYEVEVPFTPGRVDATQEQTDAESFGYLEPTNDGFRNYLRPGHALRSEYLLIDRANLLTLSAPELTVLVGGLRVLGANYRDSDFGVFTETPGVLTNDWFVNLLELGTTWKPIDADSETFQATDDATGEPSWKGTRADLVFGSNSELRALAEVYASDDAKEKFVRDFVDAWVKVAELDRFDVKYAR